jgi:aspartate-semialdehyde dehydrogenase
VTIKLKQATPVAEIERLLAAAHPWMRIVQNEREATLASLTPAAVTGSLDIAVGRIRHLPMGEDYITAFTVGDQLLWGAAEPLRRMLRLLIGR